MRLPGRSARRERGAETVEFALMLLPTFALIFLIVNVAWVIFARVCLQEAVRAGVRCAITGTYTNSGVQNYVQQHSFGMIPDASSVCVQYFSPINLSTPLASSVAVTGGDVVQVSIANVNVRPLAPLLISPAALPLSAGASDIMQTPTPPTVIYPVQCQ